MGTVGSAEIHVFVGERVNLRREDVSEYRAQVRFLRERLDAYVKEHPDFSLVAMRHFGSLAKLTATRQMHEIDLAVYLRADGAPERHLSTLLSKVRELLLQVYPTKDPSDFQIDAPAVTISLRTSGLNVDVVPLIPIGSESDRAYLPLRDGGRWTETSIPRHLDFIADAKARYPGFLELVRLTKWWRTTQGLGTNSFLLELLWVHLLRTGAVQDGDLLEAMMGFFAYLVRSNLEQPITFSESGAAAAEKFSDPVRLADPVNPASNVAAGMTATDRDALVAAAGNALDGLAQGSTAHVKGRAVEAFRSVFGPEFTA